MQAKLISAEFDLPTQRVKVNLSTSTSSGLTSTKCEQYQTYGIMSVPMPGQLVEVKQDGLANTYVTGYNNQLYPKDDYFSINPGEISLYSLKWYISASNDSVNIKPRHLGYVSEPMMMGKSTNALLTDLINYIISLEEYISHHTHSGCGGNSNSGPPTSSPPETDKLESDKDYISNEGNLAVTDKYYPKNNSIIQGILEKHGINI